jgi:hypothetical protein
MLKAPMGCRRTPPSWSAISTTLLWTTGFEPELEAEPYELEFKA